MSRQQIERAIFGNEDWDHPPARIFSRAERREILSVFETARGTHTLDDVSPCIDVFPSLIYLWQDFWDALCAYCVPSDHTHDDCLVYKNACHQEIRATYDGAEEEEDDVNDGYEGDMSDPAVLEL